MLLALNASLFNKNINTFAAGIRIHRTYNSHINCCFYATLKLHNLPVDCVRELLKESASLQ